MTALGNMIRTAGGGCEPNPKGRSIPDFGCGGRRKDRPKRPVMAKWPGRLSDLTILSSDNSEE